VEPARSQWLVVQDGTADTYLIPHDTLDPAGRAFGGNRLHKMRHRTHLTLSYRDDPGGLVLRSVWLIGQSFLDRSPAVLEDHAGAPTPPRPALSVVTSRHLRLLHRRHRAPARPRCRSLRGMPPCRRTHARSGHRSSPRHHRTHGLLWPRVAVPAEPLRTGDLVEGRIVIPISTGN
jgi:hypothetical protein